MQKSNTITFKFRSVIASALQFHLWMKSMNIEERDLVTVQEVKYKISWRIKLYTNEKFDILVNSIWPTVTIAGYPAEVIPEPSKRKVVKVWYVPDEISLNDIRSYFSDFGKVQTVEREFMKYDDPHMFNVRTEIVRVYMIVLNPIPNEFEIYGTKLMASHKDQEKLCNACRQFGHLRKECRSNDNDKAPENIAVTGSDTEQGAGSMAEQPENPEATHQEQQSDPGDWLNASERPEGIEPDKRDDNNGPGSETTPNEVDGQDPDDVRVIPETQDLQMETPKKDTPIMDSAGAQQGPTPSRKSVQKKKKKNTTNLEAEQLSSMLKGDIFDQHLYQLLLTSDEHQTPQVPEIDQCASPMETGQLQQSTPMPNIPSLLLPTDKSKSPDNLMHWTDLNRKRPHSSTNSISPSNVPFPDNDSDLDFDLTPRSRSPKPEQAYRSTN